MSALRDFIQHEVDAGNVMSTTALASQANAKMTTVWKAIRSGELIAVKIGTFHGSDEYVICREDADYWLAQRRKAWVSKASELTTRRGKWKEAGRAKR